MGNTDPHFECGMAYSIRCRHFRSWEPFERNVKSGRGGGFGYSAELEQVCINVTVFPLFMYFPFTSICGRARRELFVCI